jgi:hypothetical protein
LITGCIFLIKVYSPGHLTWKFFNGKFKNGKRVHGKGRRLLTFGWIVKSCLEVIAGKDGAMGTRGNCYFQFRLHESQVWSSNFS